MAKLILDYYKGNDHYSDGDIENDILQYIRSEKDLESILKKDTRWPVFYHLTKIRENILRWYPFKKDAEVLEIGAGMGALTKMLCKSCAHVTAVELSRRRAQAIYDRCKDEENLDIFVSNFNDLPSGKKYDYITLIGVLEYACSFTKSSNPFLTFLQKVKSYLKDDGHLLIAIENRFGLKYWCGAAEDHTFVPFDGINGYIHKNHVRTFSKKQMETLLGNAGFPYTDFYYPYPDYKLPLQIFSDQYLPKNEKIAKLHPYYQNESLLVANEIGLIRELVDNGVYEFFANSFLVDATPVVSQQSSKVIYANFNNDRKPEYRTSTLIREDRSVVKQAYSSDSERHLAASYKNAMLLKKRGLMIVDQRLDQNCIQLKYLHLPLLIEVLADTLKSGDIDSFDRLLALYQSDLLKSSEHTSGPEGDCLDHGYIDMNFSNCFFDGTNLIWFDQEWVQENVPAKFILYRALRQLCLCYPDISARMDDFKLFDRLGINEALRNEFQNRENRFYDGVFDKSIHTIFMDHGIQPDKFIDHCLSEKDKQISNLTNREISLNNTIADLNETLRSYSSELNNISRSHSWRMTAPLRVARATLNRKKVKQIDCN